MHILLINGSPKGERSNTLHLAEAFLEGICTGTKDTPTIRRLTISKMDIRPCLGCFSCWKKTPGQCCIHDEMQAVLEAILWADVTVWSFPLYYFGLPGQLKTVIDRQLPLTLPFMASDAESGGHPSRYDMTGKKTVLISTCGFYTPAGNYNSVTAQFDRICGKGNYTTLFCGEGELFSVPELAGRTAEYLTLVRQAGQEYATGGILAETHEKLGQPLFPREVFERMADASWGIIQTGEKEDPALIFTRQMAALYDPAAYRGSDIVLDMDYTDIGKRYRVHLGKDGSRVTEDFAEKPTTVIHTPFSVWKAIAAGELEGSAALMQQQYSVEGDFGLLLNWDDYFGSHGDEKKQIPEKTQMAYLLTPWMVLWIAAGIHPHWGSLLALASCCLVPLVFRRSRRTLYDFLSVALVGMVSLLLVVWGQASVILPLSYSSFGLMWSLSLFRKIPLTAEYSMYDYGGEKALGNPIFLKTNRILTALWGVFYLIMPVCTWLLRDIAPWFGIGNYLLPVILGIFTVWFQKWYPAHIAQGKRT